MIGKVIKYLRRKSGLKQEDFAKIFGIEQCTLSRYESNQRQPDFELIEKIANFCDYKIYFVNKNNNDVFEINDLKRKDF